MTIDSGDGMMDTEELAAPCGIYCGWCPHFIRNQCNGCSKEERGAPSKCPIRRCNKREENKFCSQCIEFPCQYIYSMYSDMSKFLDAAKKKYGKWQIQGTKR